MTDWNKAVSEEQMKQAYWAQQSVAHAHSTGALSSTPLRAHDQAKTLSQLFIDGGIAAVEKQVEARTASYVEKRLNAKDKECDARVDRATFKINELQDKLNFERVNNGGMGCIIDIKEKKIADLESRLRISQQDVEAANAANASFHKANEEWGNKWAAQKQELLKTEQKLEWHRAESSKELTNYRDSRQKLYAIQKAIDKEQTFGRDYLFASTIKEILGGKTIG